jgi:hypothetical protein
VPSGGSSPADSSPTGTPQAASSQQPASDGNDGYKTPGEDLENDFPQIQYYDYYDALVEANDELAWLYRAESVLTDWDWLVEEEDLVRAFIEAYWGPDAVRNSSPNEPAPDAGAGDDGAGLGNDVSPWDDDGADEGDQVADGGTGSCGNPKTDDNGVTVCLN